MNKKTPAWVCTHASAGTSRGRRILAVILSFALCLTLLPVTAFAEETEGYGITVNGTLVTESNASNVLSDEYNNNKVSYNADTNTLTISDCLCGNDGNGTPTVISGNGETDIVISNEDGNSSAAYGLTVSNAKNVTVRANSSSPSIDKNAEIDCSGDVEIINNGSGLAVSGNSFKVSKAKNVTVTSANNVATISGGSAAINCSGDVNITNSGSGTTVSTGQFKVTAAKNVTFSTTEAAPISTGGTEITCTGDVLFTNTKGDGVGGGPLTVKNANNVTVHINSDSGYAVQAYAQITCSGNVSIVNESTSGGYGVNSFLTVSNAHDVTVSAYNTAVSGSANITCSGTVLFSTAAADTSAVKGPVTYKQLSDSAYTVYTGSSLSDLAELENPNFAQPFSSAVVKIVPTKDISSAIITLGTQEIYNGSAQNVVIDSVTLDGMPLTRDVDYEIVSGGMATDVENTTVTIQGKGNYTGTATIDWSIGMAGQDAPTGLISVSPAIEGGSDGKIIGVTEKMEYRAQADSDYTLCPDGEISGLSAGKYFVRYAEDKNHTASLDTEVIVEDGAPLADFTITFNGNGGSGSMDSVIVKEGTNYTLPACEFTAPANQEFEAWEIDGTKYNVGDSYTVNADTEIKALWKNNVITPTEYTITFVGNGGMTIVGSMTTINQKLLFLPRAFRFGFYRFDGWYTAAEGGTKITINTVFSDNTTVYAHWTRIKIPFFDPDFWPF